VDFLTRRRALEAAARVAISLSAVSCGATGLDVTTQGTGSHTGPESMGDAARPAAEDAGGSSGDGLATTTSDSGSDEAAIFDASIADSLEIAYDAPQQVDSPPDAPALACNAPPPPWPTWWELFAHPRDAGVPRDTVSCCLDFVSQRLPDGGTSFAEVDRADPEVRACCVAIEGTLSAADVFRDPLGVPWACCALPDVSLTALACNPWGPPVPPAMPAAWSDAWEIS
jgi:hypothetical protein